MLSITIELLGRSSCHVSYRSGCAQLASRVDNPKLISVFAMNPRETLRSIVAPWKTNPAGPSQSSAKVRRSSVVFNHLTGTPQVAELPGDLSLIHVTALSVQSALSGMAMVLVPVPRRIRHLGRSPLCRASAACPMVHHRAKWLPTHALSK